MVENSEHQDTPEVSQDVELGAELPQKKEPFSKKSNRIHLTDFQTTKRAPWWENVADDLPPFRRDFYTNVNKLEASQKPTDASVDEKKAESSSEEEAKEVQTGGGRKVPPAAKRFADACLPRYLLEQLTKEGIESPTPIQQRALPAVMSGRDLVGIAATGSGKTLAFVLPAIVHVNDQPLLESGDGPVVLVLAPTRELVCQIEAECSKFASKCQISTGSVYGGVARDDQITQLEEGVEILIATPGRLIDFLDTNVTNVRRVTYLVLDEADRMLDMGFEQQLSRIVRHVRPDRQTLMFSATWPKEVQALAREYCCNIEEPVQIQIGGQQETVANPLIKQQVFTVTAEEKYVRFVELLSQLQSEGNNPRTIVFCQTKKGVDFLVRQLNQERLTGIKGIHGDKSQQVREQLLADFKTGRTCSVLVATDVASRGLHIDDIQYVINYDMPQQIEDYVHRVGRTARAGQKGTAYSFFTKKDVMLAPTLIKTLNKQEDQTIEVPQQLTQYAFLALKATCHDDRHFKRRWRKIVPQAEQQPQMTQAEREEILGPMAVPKPKAPKVRKTVNVAELIKQKQLAKEREAQTIDENAEGTVQATNGSAAAIETPVIKISDSYFTSSTAPQQAEDKPTPTQTKIEEVASESKTETKGAAPAQAATASATAINPVYKKKWGVKK